MGKISFVILATLVVVLVGGAVGTYAYDSSREEMIAAGITVGGVDVGGMSAEEARRALAQDIRRPAERPISVKAGDERYRLEADEARVRTDIDGMVEDAVAESRAGNAITRTFRDLTGGEVEEQLASRVTYSREAVKDFVASIEEDVNRPAQDASVQASGSGLSTVSAEDGVALREDRLARDVATALETPGGSRRVAAQAESVEPEVTERELADEYPSYITVDRASFELRYYEDLELAETYSIAVGRAGYDTPTGGYEIANKAVDPVWSVPNSDWAGELAGQTIPGGAANNPLKARWLGIYDGVGIHGTDETGSIGSAASHGCIRMTIPEVIELYDRVPTGTPVYIQ